MKTLIIDRQRWLRGEGSKQSFLLRMDGKMCCLGFLGKDCGYLDNQLLKKSNPIEMTDTSYFPQILFEKKYYHHTYSDYCGELMEINDNTMIFDNGRENILKELFLKMDINLQFIN